MKQRIAVTEHGRTRRLPRLEVIVRRLADDALRSDPAAVKLTISLLDRYAESSEAPRRLADLLEEDRAILMRWAPDAAASDLDTDKTSPSDRDASSKPDEGDGDDEL